MKRFFTFLIIAFGAAPLLFSQVTMTRASHGFSSGQNHECQEVLYQDPGASGTNCVWDFSKATLLDKIESVSNLSDEIYGQGTIRAERNDGVEFFFATTESANEYWGYKAGHTTYQLTEPIVKTKYPQTFNTQFSGKFSGTISREGFSYTSNVEGTYSTHADGIGTIILPNGTSMTALRVKTTEGHNRFERVKYLWYAQNVRLPVFVTLEDYSIATDGTKKLIDSQSFLNTKAKSPLASNLLADDFEYQVFPNPFRDNIKVSYYLPEKAIVTIELFASDGTKLVTLVSNQEQSGAQTISQNLSQYTQQLGVYLLKINIGDKTYSEKLVKTY